MGKRPMYDYREFNGAPHTFKCDQCEGPPKEEFIILEDGYRCSDCDSFYTFDEVHGNLES